MKHTPVMMRGEGKRAKKERTKIYINYVSSSHPVITVDEANDQNTSIFEAFG